jgi:GNAT superfamily N-acetyltransferase
MAATNARQACGSAFRLWRIPRVNTYEISTDPSRLQLDAIHAYLTRSYWSPGIPKEVVARAIANSMCFGVYLAVGKAGDAPSVGGDSSAAHSDTQVAFARVVTDKASFAYLADVYVLEEHRRQGLSKRLVEAVLGHPELQGMRRFLLATRDAHGLYAQFGFKAPAKPENFMEIRTPPAWLLPE